MAIDGGHRTGRPAIAGMTPIDERRIYYYLIWPTTFLSIHPDYLLVHRLEPAGAGAHPDRLPVAVRAGDDRRWPASTRPTRSSSGT